MGREIRRVPKGWEHPRDNDGDYQPMMDVTYEEALADWRSEGAAPDEKPQPEWYRPAYASEPVCWQVYETVSEGTPKSPVFDTEGELLAWLLAQGHSEKAARAFIKEGWAISMEIIIDDAGAGTFAMDIDTYDM
jgi:hypothetical protein